MKKSFAGWTMTVAMAATALGVGLAGALFSAEAAPPGAKASAAEPPVIPVGFDAYRMWERWPYQRIGARAYMRSTYDRRGNNEGADASHFLYQLADDFNVMPFFRGARLELVGVEGETFPDVRWKIRTQPYRDPGNHVGYFHASYRDIPTPESGQDLLLLDTAKTEGSEDWSGSFVGMSWIFSHAGMLSTLEGDPEGLYAANHNRLFKYFCRAVGRAEAARDLTQEVFLRVSRTAIPAAADDDLRGWLFRIARNLALDHHRSRRRHPEPSALADEPTRSSSQDVDVAVNEALASLEALDRDVFLMREVAGLGYDEIASACELTADAVRSRIHRTRLQLRDQLAAPIATFQTMAISSSGKTNGSIDG